MNLSYKLPIKFLWIGSTDFATANELCVKCRPRLKNKSTTIISKGMFTIGNQDRFPIDVIQTETLENIKQDFLSEYDALIINQIPPEKLPEYVLKMNAAYFINDLTWLSMFKYSESITFFHLQQDIQLIKHLFNQWSQHIRFTRMLTDCEKEHQKTLLERDDAKLGLAMLGQKLVEIIEHDEEASTIQERFLAIVSHELRTPLNGIIGMSELLSDTELNEEQQEEIRLIHTSSQRLANMVDSMLDFHSLKNSNTNTFLSEFDLYKCVEQTIEHLQSQAISTGIVMYDLIDSSTPQYIYNDREKIRKIIYCLVSNAIKFTNKGTVTIQLNCVPRPGDVDHLEIQVKDTGIGIAAQDMKTLYEPFTQLEDYHTRSHEGMGIGLYTAKNLAKILEGSIHVKSTLGSGSTFTFSLPLTKTTNSINQIQSIWPQIRDARILVWTDDLLLQKILSKQLHLAGCKINFISDYSALETCLSDNQSTSDRTTDLLLIDDRKRQDSDSTCFERIMIHRTLPAVNLLPKSSYINDSTCEISPKIAWDHQCVFLQQQYQLMLIISKLFQNHHINNKQTRILRFKPDIGAA